MDPSFAKVAEDYEHLFLLQRPMSVVAKVRVFGVVPQGGYVLLEELHGFPYRTWKEESIRQELGLLLRNLNQITIASKPYHLL